MKDTLTDEQLDEIKKFSEKLVKGDREKKRNGISTSQLRKFFGELRRIQNDYDNKKNEIIKLNIYLAYAVGRDMDERRKNYKTVLIDFYNFLSPGIKFLSKPEYNTKQNFDHFVEVVEAIVAFHKFYGGK